jgi:hypothetical protein
MASMPLAMPLTMTRPRAARSRPPIERRAARANDTGAGKIQNEQIATDIQQNGGIVNLQQRLRILGVGPVQKAAACDLSNSRQFLLSARESFLLDDGLRDLSGKIAGFEIVQRSTEDTIR